MGVGTVSGSGIFIKKGDGIRICKKIPDYCLVCWAELLAIEVLKFCFTESVNTDIRIFNDSRSSIQHLSEGGGMVTER
ncbi:RNase H domain-containing protein [Trichonephila clavipes]|nr:RNase H domain-containing protein [Trichonephila clavipes]